MMKKFGFTLAEVLITLSIIGVVAALTTPALVNNIGNAKIGPTLSKFNSTFSNAINLVKAQSALTQFHSNRDTLIDEIGRLSQHMIIVPYERAYTFTDALGQQSHTIFSEADLQRQLDETLNAIMTGNNPNNLSISDVRNITEQMLRNPIVYSLNDGTVMAIVPAINNQAIARGVYRGVVGEVLIDIDGDKSSNRAGVDVFGFLLDSTGLLIPAGSAAHRFVGQSGSQFITGVADCHSGTATLNENFACTGRIADNNWNTKGINLD